MIKADNSPSPRAFVVFCDDIRDEISRKPMLIGVYPAEMVLHVAPPAAAQLQMYIVIDDLDPPEKEISLELQLKHHPDDGSSASVVLHGKFDVAADAVADGKNSLRRVVFRPPKAVVQIPSSGYLEPRLIASEAGGDIPIGGGIRVSFRPQHSGPAPAEELTSTD